MIEILSRGVPIKAWIEGVPLEDEARARQTVQLSHDQCVAACSNFGIDLKCGSCACRFFTGFSGYPHDQSCSTDRFIKSMTGELPCVKG